MKGHCIICNEIVDETQQVNGICHNCSYRMEQSRISISLNLNELMDICSMIETYDRCPNGIKSQDINPKFYQERFFTLIKALKFGIFSNWDVKPIK